MVEDKRANRYSLKLMDINGDEYVIPINYNGQIKEKMPLTVIDRMTTGYESKEDLKKELMKLGYNYGYLFIEYKAKGKRKTLEVAYADKELIAKESNLRENAITNGKEEPKITENVVLLGQQLIGIERNNKKLWSYLQRKNYMWTDLTLLVATFNHLIDIEASQNDILSYQYDIMKNLSNYNTFRKITMGIDEYFKKENYQETKEDIVEKTIKKKLKK